MLLSRVKIFILSFLWCNIIEIYICPNYVILLLMCYICTYSVSSYVYRKKNLVVYLGKLWEELFRKNTEMFKYVFFFPETDTPQSTPRAQDTESDRNRFERLFHARLQIKSRAVVFRGGRE